jgi:alkylation response protein AidB-like acyl-CoA dehydrogenase
MIDLAHLDWPFFAEPHRRLAPGLAAWADAEIGAHVNRADVDASCRAVVRALGDAGWLTRESSMAKAFATERAQAVIDRAVQISGAHGVRAGTRVEALYREIRALRIYEGATDVQKIVVARELMKARKITVSDPRGLTPAPGKASEGSRA